MNLSVVFCQKGLEIQESPANVILECDSTVVRNVLAFCYREGCLLPPPPKKKKIFQQKARFSYCIFLNKPPGLLKNFSKRGTFHRKSYLGKALFSRFYIKDYI